MASNKIVETENVAETPAKLVAYINGKTSEHWVVDEVVQVIGTSPSYATITIPSDSVDEAANSIAFSAEWASKLRIGNTVRVDKIAPAGARDVVFRGIIARINHDRNFDAIIVTVHDLRMKLNEIRVTGRFVIHNPDLEEDEPADFPSTYQQAFPAIANPGGRANRVRDQGSEIAFSPWPDFGLHEDEQPPPPGEESMDSGGAGGVSIVEAGAGGVSGGDGSDRTVATYWTLSTILEYLRQCYGPNATTPTLYPWIGKAPSGSNGIIWPEDFGANIDLESVANFNGGRDQNNSRRGTGRKGRTLNMEGVGLLDVLHTILDTAGGYDIYLDPEGNALRCVQTRYISGGKDLVYGAGGTADGAGNATITGGSFEEDGSETLTAMAVAGSPYLLEVRLYSLGDEDEAEVDGDGNDIVPGLKAGWTVPRQDAFLTYLLELDEPDDGGWLKAIKLFPEVLCTWQVDRGFDLFSETIFDFDGKTPVYNSRPVWPHLVSIMGGESGLIEFANQYFPVQFEAKIEGTWYQCPEADGFEIWEDGKIYVPGLRQAGYDGLNGSWRWADAPFGDPEGTGMVQIVVQGIRATLVLPLDDRLTALASIGSQEDWRSFPAFEQLFQRVKSPDENRIKASYSKVGYTDANGLYECQFRRDSWPRPESLNSTDSILVAQAADKLGLDTAVRSDHVMIADHAARSLYEFGRLRKSGTLEIDGHLINSLSPGTAVEKLTGQVVGDGGGFNSSSLDVKAIIQQVRMIGTPGAIKTEISIG